MAGIFISYRQADAKAWAIALRDDLADIFGDEQVFLDKDTLHAGNWHEQIQRALDHCKVVLVVIGLRWLTVADEQERPRIQLADDIHHQEIALALSRPGLTVIPVLVDEASMPRAEQLPADLQKLTEQQARKMGDTRERRKADLAVLVKDIESVAGLQPRAQSAPQDLPGSQSPAARTGRLRLDVATLGLAFALTLAAAMSAYLGNSQLGAAELLFLLLFFYAAVLTAKWLWTRLKSARARRA